MNAKCNSVIALLLIWGLIGSSCQSPHKTAETRTESDTLSVLLADHQWQSNLAFWLSIGYEENDTTASFASISPDFLRQPNLYTTYGMVGILTEMGEKVENPRAIAEWVDSLRNEQGAYNDSGPRDLNSYPLVIETAWAVITLNNLGIPPHNPGQTVAFIRSLQRDDGLFHPDTSIGGPEEEQALVATHYAIKALLTLGIDLAHASHLRGTQEALVDYLAAHPIGASPDLMARESRYFIEAAWSLAQIDPSAVPEEVRLSLQRALNKVPSLPGETLSIAHLDLLPDILDIAESIGLPDAGIKPGPLERYVTDRVLPQLRAEGGYAFTPAASDPILTYKAVEFLRRMGVLFPYPEDVLQGVARYRIENGWITFVRPMPNPQSTYYALAIAQQIGYDHYDPAKVGRYLRQFLRRGRKSLRLRDVYFALRGLKLLGQQPDQRTLRELRAKAISKMQESANGAGGELLELAQLARTLDWKLPGLVQDQVVQTLGQLGPIPKTMQIMHFHELTVLQSVAGVEVLPPEKIREKVLALWTREGGFKTSSNAPMPDLHATFLALDTLSLLHHDSAVDQKAVIKFVLSCKADYGFNYIPSHLIEKFPSAGPSLGVTYAGIKILSGQ